MSKMSPEAQALYHKRINNVVFGLMEGTSIGTWLVLQVLPSLTGFLEPISVFIGIVGTILYTLWLYLAGAYDVKKNRLLQLGTTIAAAVIEIVPFIDDIPADVIEDTVLVLMTRVEDRQIAEAKAVAAKKASMEQVQRTIQYNIYAERQYQKQQVAVANDNARQAANARARQEAEDIEDDEFEYQEAA